MTLASERHEQRLAAQARVLRAKDSWTKIACAYVAGHRCTAEEVKLALLEVENARASLRRAIDGALKNEHRDPKHLAPTGHNCGAKRSSNLLWTTRPGFLYSRRLVKRTS